MDAQAVWAELNEHMTTSASASLQRSQLMTHLTTARFDTNFPGTAVQFVLNWQQQVRNYQEMSVNGTRISEELLLTLLQNAVHGVPDLRAVKNQMQYDQAKTGWTINYRDYCALLQEAATLWDDANGKRVQQGRFRRHKVNLHSIGETQSPATEPSDLVINEANVIGHDQAIDLSPQELYAASRATETAQGDRLVVHEQQQREPRKISMPREIWDLLTPEIQEKIKEHNSGRGANTPKRSVQFHDSTPL